MMAASNAPAAKSSVQGTRRRRPKAQRRKARLRNRRILRLGVQVLFFVLAPGLFSGALSGVKHIAGNIGGLQPVELTSFVLLLIALVASTVALGRFFCGYACAFGLLGDVVYGVSSKLRSLLRIPQLPFPAPLVRGLQLVKYAILTAICVLCFFGAYDAAASCSPWTAFASLIAGSTEGVRSAAFILLGIVMCAMMLRERFFCQFLCPMGALFALLPVLPFSSFDRDSRNCPRSCGQCRKRCPVSIWPERGRFGAGECIDCGACALGCPIDNIGVVRIEQRPAQRKPRLLLTGTGWGTIIVKALLLLLACWLVGALRFVPSPAELLPFGLPWMLS